MLINPCYKPILPILAGSRALNFWCPEIKVNEGNEGSEGSEVEEELDEEIKSPRKRKPKQAKTS